MYVCGLVIPVPEDRLDAYRLWAEAGAKIFREHGCLEIVESWEDFVPDGEQTDFRRAVAARPGEKIVFTWQVWPDKATLDAAEAKMHTEGRLDAGPDPGNLVHSERDFFGHPEPRCSCGQTACKALKQLQQVAGVH